MAKIDRVQEVSTEILKPYGNNAKIHSDEQVQKIADSIKEFGFLNPVLIDGNHNIIAGHGRVMAAKLIGMENVPCVNIEGLNEAQRRAYILADNRLAELAEWDDVLVNEELADLSAMNFDVDLTGFEFDSGGDWFADHERNDTGYQDGNEEYNEFLDKFENKKTTDDCYTPDLVYDAVARFVVEEYGASHENFVRPFFPGGDYQNFKYPADCIVVDNPPFSILAEIVRFYQERNIRFFLFAPALTIFSSCSTACAICTAVSITYENGAQVSTSFITNLEDGLRFRSCPRLYEAVKNANTENQKALRKELPKYSYPDQVATATGIAYLSKYGIDYRAKLSESYRISGLDSQKEVGKAIFGNGFLISEKAAAEKAAAEKAAAEKAAATRWSLSESEWEIVKSLG